MAPDRREFLEALLGLAVLPMLGDGAARAETEAKGGGRAVAKDIVMIHGANEGAWCFDRFRTVFERAGFTCHAPDLIGHGTKDADAAKTLIGVGMQDYLAELEAFLKTFPPKPVLLGHSMGAILAQQLAARGLASALILVAPAPHSGILPRPMRRKRWPRT
jgi:pimeloyl-ACP methyl ester carboxylesterase